MQFNKIIFLFGILLVVVNFADAQEFTSGDKQVPLIELYTSEGCSSCPPADKWLSSLTSYDGLFIDFVPLALHVDYWDHIGWKDPFATPEYSQRQRQYAHEYKEPTVYTPGVRKGGKEWRTWRLWGEPTEDESLSVGSLTVEMTGNGQFKAEYFGHSQGDLQLNIAVLGMGLETKVKRGENQGKVLKHDFVVLSLSRFVSVNKPSWSGAIDQPKLEAKQYALAAWLSNKGRVKPLQSIGGYLDSTTWESSL